MCGGECGNVNATQIALILCSFPWFESKRSKCLLIRNILLQFCHILLQFCNILLQFWHILLQFCTFYFVAILHTLLQFCHILLHAILSRFVAILSSLWNNSRCHELFWNFFFNMSCILIFQNCLQFFLYHRESRDFFCI